jgi:uncharacterized membrane protein
MSHQHPHDIFEDRKQFQIERLILFSDAVFAIAITLLVIEIKVPELHEYDTQAILKALGEHFFSSIFGFILSFAVIGQFWINHHRLFGFVTNYNTGLLWLNLLMLFWIVLVPFTSALNSRYGGLDLVWMIYSANLAMIALSIYFLFKYIGNPKRHLSLLTDKPLHRKYSAYRSLSTAFIFFLGVALCLFHNKYCSWAARFVFFLIPITLRIINKRANKAFKSEPM